MNITEISSKQHQYIIPLLGKYSDYPVINAVIEGNATGRIFVDTPVDPESAYVLTKAGFSYLVGSPKNFDFNLALKDLLNDQIFAKIKKTGDPTLIFYPLVDGWEAPLKEILSGHEVYDIFRKQFAFHPEKFPGLDQQVPAGFGLQPIDKNLLDKFGASMFPWESPQAFLEHGFGFWLLKDEQIACECSSVFVGGAAVEIHIRTDDNFHRQGLGTIAASAFIAECLKRGLHPNWECWWDNEPSVTLAQKLGFEAISNHPVFLVEL